VNRRRSIVKSVAVSAVLAVAFIPTLTIATWELLHGRGGTLYTNVYGLATPYTLVLILVAALVIAFIARLIYFWVVAGTIQAGAPSEKRLDVRRHPCAAATTKRHLMERA
jgi:hypothetical protein